MKKLNHQTISALKAKYHPIRFNNPFDLVYENQVPNTGIVLIGGKASLVRRKKELEIIEPGSVFGVKELAGGETVRYGCQVESNAEVILLTKSDVLTALNDEENPLHEIIQKD